MANPNAFSIRELFKFTMEVYNKTDEGRQDAIKYVAYSLNVSEEVVQEAVKFC